MKDAVDEDARDAIVNAGLSGAAPDVVTRFGRKAFLEEVERRCERSTRHRRSWTTPPQKAIAD